MRLNFYIAVINFQDNANQAYLRSVFPPLTRAV